MKQTSQPPDKRLEPRATKLTDHMAEFKLTGVPIYQLKVRDLSAKGAGIVVRADSNILKMIQVGQELNVKMIPETTSPGCQRSRIEHISEIKEGRYHGHMVVGISILNQIS